MLWSGCPVPLASLFCHSHTRSMCIGKTNFGIVMVRTFEKKVLLSSGTLVPSAIGALHSISHIEYLENK